MVDKIAIINDIHQGARQDSLTFNEYFMKFWDKVFFPELEKQGITQVWILGDIMDRRKYVNYVILNSFRQNVVERLSNYNVDVLVGNHDLPYKNMNSPNSPQELFGNLSNWKIWDKPDIWYHGPKNEPILILPWLDPHYQPEQFIHAVEMMRSTRARVAFGHLELLGFEMDKGNVNLGGFRLDELDKFDLILSGHYHHKSSKNNVHYLGSPYQMTWADYGSPKGFHIYDISTRELEFIKNPNTIYTKWTYNDKGDDLKALKRLANGTLPGVENYAPLFKDKYLKIIVTGKNDPFLFDQVRDKIEEFQPLDISIYEDFSGQYDMDSNDEDKLDDGNLQQGQDTQIMLNDYIDSQGYTEDIAAKLKAHMQEVYVEALNTENVNEGTH